MGGGRYNGEWSGDQKLTRPRGLPTILKAVIATPPDDGAILVDLANDIGWAGYDEEGLVLLRIAMGRLDLSADTRMLIASLLARRYRLADEAKRMFDTASASTGYDHRGVLVEIAEAKLYHGYDAASAKLLVEACLERLNQEAFHSYLTQDEIRALEVAGAKQELMQLGDAYLAQAGQPADDAEGRGNWYALASETYRGAGEIEKAVSAAREGLAFVEPAIVARITFGEEKPKPITDKRAAAVQAGYGDAPVIALYRAGARDEALATGFLTGYDRYFHADIAGEARDPVWILEDKSSFYDGILMHFLISAADGASGERAYCYRRAHDIFGKNFVDDANRELGLLAALSGHRRTMESHFAASAHAIDTGRNGATVATRAWAAFQLAADWRRGRSIVNRVSPADTTTDPVCPS